MPSKCRNCKGTGSITLTTQVQCDKCHGSTNIHNGALGDTRCLNCRGGYTEKKEKITCSACGGSGNR